MYIFPSVLLGRRHFIEVREVHKANDGRDPFPILIKRDKMPKNRDDVQSTFPSVVMELSDQEIKVNINRIHTIGISSQHIISLLLNKCIALLL